MTQTELAANCAISQATIAQIESSKRTGTVVVLKKIADVLRLDLDDLV
jgi:transcriptional regulator with XRE-family HTH domain